MKKPLFKGLLFAILIAGLVSCGSSRKLGCPSQAKNPVQIKAVA